MIKDYLTTISQAIAEQDEPGELEFFIARAHYVTNGAYSLAELSEASGLSESKVSAILETAEAQRVDMDSEPSVFVTHGGPLSADKSFTPTLTATEDLGAY